MEPIDYVAIPLILVTIVGLVYLFVQTLIYIF